MLEEIEISKSLLELIIKYRHKADYTTHKYSNAVASEIIPCTDLEIVTFFNEMMNSQKASLCISNICWEESSNCIGDVLYPVDLYSTNLNSNTILLELIYFDQEEQNKAFLYYVK